ncbi:cytochrome-c peroxidase [Mesonia aestuariivivens]|uniref:Cytochrome-c peroxidase n=1 Tax=Mesonia aestuariivivens TaxID=2796128 RepID=A0ABS6W0D1_9FLAO|nr:cytochrome c peroxidase [Mesonia aestuariivivens]MBW2960584.1 cytochrome-c peroxidase [Mesonia aestuariivivens]
MYKKILLIIITTLLFSCKSDKQENYQSITFLREVYASGNSENWPAPNLDSSINNFKDIGHLPKVKFPNNNPYSKEKVNLGKKLFFDPRLSVSGQIACASCHNSELAWTDNLTRSFGHNRQNGKRNAMTIMNVAFAHELFWDGRANSLEDQARFPIADELEMNEKLNLAVHKIKEIEGYKPLFVAAFNSDEVSLERIQKAIATYERTIISRTSKFDRFIDQRPNVYSDEEVLGLHLFRTKARCINCHNTGYFSDNQYHNDGQVLFGTKNEDFGRFHVTGDTADIGKFRTPTLREVARTGPWMHNGHFPSLRDVIEFYNLGNPQVIQKRYLGTPRDSLIPEVSPLLHKLELTKDEINALEAFLKTLSSKNTRIHAPELPE